MGRRRGCNESLGSGTEEAGLHEVVHCRKSGGCERHKEDNFAHKLVQGSDAIEDKGEEEHNVCAKLCWRAYVTFHTTLNMVRKVTFKQQAHKVVETSAGEGGTGVSKDEGMHTHTNIENTSRGGTH